MSNERALSLALGNTKILEEIANTRNIAAIIGGIYARKGTSFTIYYYGKVTLTLNRFTHES